MQMIRSSVFALLLCFALAGASPAQARAEASGASSPVLFLRELAGMGSESTDAALRLTGPQREALRALQKDYAAALQAHQQTISSSAKDRSEANKDVQEAVEQRREKNRAARAKLEAAQAERERLRDAIQASKPGSPEREKLRVQRDAAIKEVDRLRAELQELAEQERANVAAEREKRDATGQTPGPRPDFNATRAKMLAALTEAQRAELARRIQGAESSMDELLGVSWRGAGSDD
ncbi:MAG: hypothetical protein ACKVZJ_02520 [Phycisphaerales bacterium]